MERFIYLASPKKGMEVYPMTLFIQMPKFREYDPHSGILLKPVSYLFECLPSGHAPLALLEPRQAVPAPDFMDLMRRLSPTAWKDTPDLGVYRSDEA